MSEGEFKVEWREAKISKAMQERLKKVLKVPKPECWTMLDPDEQTYVSLRDLENILGEAAKEHPINQYLGFTPETTIAEINRILNYRQQEWFKKWFGASKNE